MGSNALEIDNKKAIIWGAVIIAVQMGVYSVLWLNPFVADISNEFIENPAVKPYEYFGGLDNWMKIRTIYNIVLLTVLVKLFLMFYEKIPGKGWLKGVCFGLIISLVKIFPEAFNKWTLIVYPEELILLQLINGCLGLVILGVLMSVIFSKTGVITRGCSESRS